MSMLLTPNRSVMKNNPTYNILFSCIITCFCSSIVAQYSDSSGVTTATANLVDHRMDNYLFLKNQGYKDKEIFEDLGNANFLNENYVSALFWYERLKEVSKNGNLSVTYEKRYKYATSQSKGNTFSQKEDRNDWLAQIKSDYQIPKAPKENILDKPIAERYRKLDFQQKDGNFIVEDPLPTEGLEKLTGVGQKEQNGYSAPVSVTPDGRTAYFSKVVYMKPVYGVFSKKEAVNKIYRAEKINGEWQNIEEVALEPKHASSMHPSVSYDGKRLFFASNMPGTFGEFDIYVSEIRSDGTLGVAKNLGTKVNTTKNDLYPNAVSDNILFFASEGREGQGGLDVYMTEVGQRKVGLAVNLGSPINSAEDDFAVSFASERAKGYVMTNRGNNKSTVQRVAFTYVNEHKPITQEKDEYEAFEAFNPNSKIRYANSVFEDE